MRKFQFWFAVHHPRSLSCSLHSVVSYIRTLEHREYGILSVSQNFQNQCKFQERLTNLNSHSYSHHNKPNSGIIPRAEGERVACNPNSYREFSSVMNSSAARGPISIFLLSPCTFISHAVAMAIFISFCFLLLQHSPKVCSPSAQHGLAWSTCFRTALRRTYAPYRTHSLQCQTLIQYTCRIPNKP